MSEKYGNLLKRVKDKQLKELCSKLAFTSAPAKDASLPSLTFRLEAKRTANNPQKNNAVVDEVIIWLAPYFLLDGGKALEKVEVSLDPFVAFPLAMFFEQQGVKIKREKDFASEGRGVIVDVPTGQLDAFKTMDPAKLEAALVAPGQTSKL